MIPQVTVVIVPRERFSYTQKTLESLYQNTTLPFKLIYVDGKSPAHIRHYLQQQSQERGFRLICKDEFLHPNQARNLALAEVDTEYVVFVDNDVLFTPGWLNQLVQCAQETQAWVVGPLYCEGQPEDEIIHMAGGYAHFRLIRGEQRFFEQHRHLRKPLVKLRSQLRREVTELIEFHCALVRTSVFQQVGFLDEEFLSTSEHVDFCLLVREQGGSIYFEPNSVISYVVPPPFQFSDLPYFLWRWSDAWNQQSLEHFRDKWHLRSDDPFITNKLKWLNRHRQRVIRESIRQFLPFKGGAWLNNYFLMPLEKQFNKFLVKTANRKA